MRILREALIMLIFTVAILLVSTPAAFAAEGDTLFFDDFNDGNLDGWTIEFGNWYTNNGNLVGSRSGRAFGGRVDTGNTEWDNYRLELDVNGFQGIDQGIGFRYSQNGYYEVNLRYGTGIYDTPQVKLWKNRGNEDWVLLTDTHSFPLINNQWYPVKIEALNENIKVWINNTLIFDFTDLGTNVKKGTVTLSYWTGDVGIAYMRFDNVKVTALAPPPSSKTPLILIPGIGGSELKVTEDTFWNKDDGHGGTFNRAYSKDEKVWVNEEEAAKLGDDDYFDILRMKPDGVTPEANLDLSGNVYAGAYQETINFFISNGYTLNQDLFVFPYDWRVDLAGTAPQLDQKIQEIKQQTGSQKVDIIAHSMGGLVARNYIADPTRAQNVRKLFTLGTPHLGSVKFLKALRYGYCLLVEVGPLCLSMAPSEMKDVIQNMITGFQLAPSQTYFNFYSDEDSGHPYPYRTGDGSLNYLQIKNLLTGFGHNTTLFNPAEAFHSLDNSLSNTNGVEVTIIAGSGVQTLGQIIEKTITTLNGNKITYKDKVDINGDGTVPLLSASITDPHKGLFLNGNAEVFYSNQEHGGLVFNGPALNLVNNILSGNNQLPSGIATQPSKLSGYGLSVHSPVNIHVYDPNGNHTGPTNDGDFEANIPGSSYDSLGDAKFIYLPENGIYDVKFEAIDKGNFDFKIRKFENDENIQTFLYKDIPLTNETKAETEFSTLSPNPPALQIDQDGNGTIDKEASPSSILTGDAVNDLTPPQTEILVSGTKGLNRWYKSDVAVTLNALDEENGSGILKTEYTMDGQTINTYTGPFTVSEEKVNLLKVKSTDNAGNEENPKEMEIKIDKTAPEAKVFVDLDKLDLVVEGLDSNPTTIITEPNIETRKKDDVIYTITDIAGNTTRLDVRERDKEKRDRFRIHSIKYNDQEAISLPSNYFNVIYKGKKDKLNVSEQNFELRKEVRIRIRYNSWKNQSTIIVVEPREEKIKEVRNGLVILHLLTNKGQLETSY